MSDTGYPVERVAYHEAGHAVLSILLREPFTLVTIVPQAGGDGCIVWCPRPRKWRMRYKEQPDGSLALCPADAREDRHIDRILITYNAGFAAEVGLLGTHPLSQRGAGSDYDAALEILKVRAFNGDEAMSVARLNEVQDMMSGIVNCLPIRLAIKSVASALMAKRTLTSRQVREIVTPFVSGDSSWRRVLKRPSAQKGGRHKGEKLAPAVSQATKE